MCPFAVELKTILYSWKERQTYANVEIGCQ